MQWHTKLHGDSYRDRLERAHARLAAALAELELVMLDVEVSDVEPEQYAESAADLRANA